MKNQSYEQRVKKNKIDDFEKQFFKLMNKAVFRSITEM